MVNSDEMVEVEIEIPDEEAEGISTVKNAVDYISNNS